MELMHEHERSNQSRTGVGGGHPATPGSPHNQATDSIEMYREREREREREKERERNQTSLTHTQRLVNKSMKQGEQ